MDLPDLIITVAYFTIPVQILVGLWKYPRVTRRATPRVVVLLVLFALFIFLCGFGHLIRCLGHGDTTLFRVTNILTAVVSLGTSMYLMPFIPMLLEGTDKLYLEVTTSKQIFESMYPPTIRERMLKRGSNDSIESMDVLRTERPMKHSSSCDDSADDSDECLHVDHQSRVLRRKRNMIPRRRMQDFLKRRHASNVNETFENPRADDSDPAIADLFPHTSIMFADISNFTYWSSNHSPDQVFALLETIFFQFDMIASDMEVFKLSTVGDCYIAATGVPTPQDDHAILLSRFAERCRRNGNDVLQRLSLQDGMSDVSQLSIRIGIHSGPVTAGVLRGQKARFDLFGDTINTAARIESTGEPNRVHLSRETAELLEAAGKGDWLIPREKSVSAKGKGELTTFWLQVLDTEENVESGYTWYDFDDDRISESSVDEENVLEFADEENGLEYTEIVHPQKDSSTTKAAAAVVEEWAQQEKSRCDSESSLKVISNNLHLSSSDIE